MSTDHRYLSPLSLLAAFAFGVSLTGCGDGRIPTSGVVTLDGDPVPDAAVMFLPADGGRPATGRTDADGRFDLTTVRPGDGAAAGKYRVTVTACETLVPEDEAGPLTEEEQDAERLRWIVPQRYSRADSSGLEAAISHSEHHFQFRLTNE